MFGLIPFNKHMIL